MKFRSLLHVLLLALIASPAFCQEPAELQRLRTAYDAAAQRAMKPVTETYLQELKRLKDSFARAGKLDEAVRVDAEMQAITAKLAAMGVAVAPVGAAAGQTTVVNARATIVPSNPDAYKLPPLRKGDVISLKYVEGKWKDHGVLASYSPDDPKSEEKSRLVIAAASKGGVPGDTVVVVPPGTAGKPFTYSVPTSRDDLVLRIASGSTTKENPGQVVYQVKITR